MLKQLVTGFSLWRFAYVGFVVDALSLQQAFLKVLWFYTVAIIAPMLDAHPFIQSSLGILHYIYNLHLSK
jgi:hypothetical protein